MKRQTTSQWKLFDRANVRDANSIIVIEWQATYSVGVSRSMRVLSNASFFFFCFVFISKYPLTFVSSTCLSRFLSSFLLLFSISFVKKITNTSWFSIDLAISWENERIYVGSSLLSFSFFSSFPFLSVRNMQTLVHPLAEKRRGDTSIRQSIFRGCVGFRFTCDLSRYVRAWSNDRSSIPLPIPSYRTVHRALVFSRRYAEKEIACIIYDPSLSPAKISAASSSSPRSRKDYRDKLVERARGNVHCCR